jgi:hypothetical protein
MARAHPALQTLGTVYFFLGLPWALIVYGLTPAHSKAVFPVLFLGAGATVSLLVLLMRYWVLRIRN